jgi:sugar phosphate isomerase/epimerase
LQRIVGHYLLILVTRTQIMLQKLHEATASIKALPHMADLSRLSINQATTKSQWGLRQAVEGYAAEGVRAIGVWRDALAELGVGEAARLLGDHGMTVSGLCRGGFFTAPDREGRLAAVDDNRRAVDEAAAISAQCLVIVAGGLPQGSRDLAGARSMVCDGLGALIPYAEAAGVPLAIEPLHPMYAADRCCINTLGQALDLCETLENRAGVAIDVYHLWWDPDLETQIARAGSRILGYHVCDWLVPTRDVLLDRGMMGQGVIDIPQITSWVGEAGYRGAIEVEIFSRDWWSRPPEEVVQAVKAAFGDVV